ncbi:MAG: hypothetical protein ACLFQA_00335 [Bacteroidales bacterium]
MSIYKGSGGSFTIATDTVFQELICVVVGRSSRTVYEKYSTVERDEYEQLTGTGPYTGILTESVTNAMIAEFVDVEMKMIIDDIERPVGVGEIAAVKSTEVGKLMKHE